MSEPLRRELVRARIVVTDDVRYSVRFTCHGNRPADADLVRFALHFYARVLYEMVHAHRSVRDLPNKIEALVSKPYELRAAARIHVMEEGDALDAILISPGYRRFEFHCDLTGRSEPTLKRSLLSVLECVTQTVPEELRTLLNTALLNMNVSYGVTHRYADLRSIEEVPAIAYQAASFV